MDILKKGPAVYQTIKNMARLKEIVTVFAKHGFADFLTFGITSKIPNFVLPKSHIKLKEKMNHWDRKEFLEVFASNLRNAFEELGPSFIKLGQLLSTREDFIHPIIILELKKLTDSALPISFEEAKKTIEHSLQGKIEQFFEIINPVPIGMASIGVVYEGRLLTKEEIVIKVKRPGIEKLIKSDFSLISFIIHQVEWAFPEIKYLGISKVIQDFNNYLLLELNFSFELINAKKFKKNLSSIDIKKLFYVPIVYETLSSSTILVMEKIQGIPFSRPAEILEKSSLALEDNLHYGVGLFMRSMLSQGLFHGDLHGGNFFLLPSEQIGLIDFGLMGTLSVKNRQNFLSIIYALVTQNYDQLAYEFLDVAEYEELPEIDTFIRDIKYALSPYLGLSISQTNFATVFNQVSRILRNHRLFLPREWFVIFRSFITLDGVGRSLKIDFNVFEILDKEVRSLLKDGLQSKVLVEESLWTLKDLLESFRISARHWPWYLKRIQKNNFAIPLEIKGLSHHQESIRLLIKYTSLLLFSGILFLCGIFLKDTGPMPWEKGLSLYTLTFFSLASFFMLLSLKKLLKI